MSIQLSNRSIFAVNFVTISLATVDRFDSNTFFDSLRYSFFLFANQSSAGGERDGRIGRSAYDLFNLVASSGSSPVSLCQIEEHLIDSHYSNRDT